MFRKILFGSLFLVSLLALIQCSEETKIIPPPPVNHAPVLSTIADTNVVVGDTLSLTVTATDANSTIPTLSCLTLPDNAIFTDNKDGSGIFEFTPSELQLKLFKIKFVASDGELADTMIFKISVKAILNNPPVFEEVDPQTVRVGDTLNLTITASDPDSSDITLYAENLPYNSSFIDNDDGTGLFEFIPDTTQIIDHQVLFIAKDDSNTTIIIVQITVLEKEKFAPVINEINDQQVIENDTLTITISATDIDSDLLILSAINLPNNSSFIDNQDGSGLFEFIPDESQVQLYEVNFIASDGVLADTQLVKITVLDKVNNAPNFEEISDQNIFENELLSFEILATDPDGDSLTLIALNIPENSTFIDNLNGSSIFEFSPNFDQAGNYQITFIASDGLLADTVLLTITVENVNRAPVITSPTIFEFSVTESDTLEIEIIATDPDGDQLTISINELPKNSVLTDNGNGTGVFVFRPDSTQIKQHLIKFIIKDQSLSDTDYVQITVLDKEHIAPIFNEISDQIGYENGILVFTISAIHPNDELIIFTTLDLPENATFTDNLDNSGTFEFNPSFEQAGDYQVTFIASDGDLGDVVNVNIKIINVNREPIINHSGDLYVIFGDTLDLVISASDPDGDNLYFTSDDLFENMQFIDNGNRTARLVFTPSIIQIDDIMFTIYVHDDSTSTAQSLNISIITVEELDVYKHAIIPCAIGNYWIYKRYDTTDTVKIEIIDVKTISGEIWWILDNNFPILGNRFKIVVDEVHTEQNKIISLEHQLVDCQDHYLIKWSCKTEIYIGNCFNNVWWKIWGDLDAESSEILHVPGLGILSYQWVRDTLSHYEWGYCLIDYYIQE